MGGLIMVFKNFRITRGILGSDWNGIQNFVQLFSVPSFPQILLRVIFPLSVPGIASGITMVFVPSVSTFIISRMLGGGTNMLIGDLIDLQFLGNAYNPNLGAAMSLVLMVFIFLCMSITNQIDNVEMEGGVI